MSAKRLALFLPSLVGGGAERAVVKLAQGFSERGLSVDLVTANADGPYRSQVPRGVRVVDLGVSRVVASVPGLVTYLRRERPQALLSALDHANVVALWAQRLSGIRVRVVVTVHTTPSHAIANAPSLRVRLMPILVRYFYPWAHTVVAVSQGVAEDLIRLTRLPREKVRVIYNPVVTSDLFTKAEEPVDHPWFAVGEPPVILGVGRLTAAKDYLTLIRAFALVRKERPARLLILGEGEERPKLEASVRELGLEKDVALPGFVDNPYKYMKRAAVFVLSSRWEGLPTALIEALALGTAVVATNCPSGPAEILEEGRWGRLVPVGDVKAMALAIMEALDDPNAPQGTQRASLFELHMAVDAYLDILGITGSIQHDEQGVREGPVQRW